MAPQIQPESLYGISIASVSNLIDQACTTIFLEYGSFGNDDCLLAIRHLQKHLLATLPLSVFEHLMEERNNNSRSSFQRTNQLVIWSKDPRIKLGIFLHPAITKFSVDGRGNELMLPNQQDDIHGSCCSFMGGLDEIFWSSHIRRLVNIVSLNLNYITTDEILHLIGANCRKLEVVNIVARIKQDVAQNYISTDPTVDGQPSPPFGQFPGICLKFCVSDVGLASLLSCHRLRSITMNKIVNQTPASRGISLVGVRSLVFGLPNLEFISFGSLGKVLAEDTVSNARGNVTKKRRLSSRTLKLTHFSEMDPSFMNVKRLRDVCPNVRHVSLSMPVVIHDDSDNNDVNSVAVDILNDLSESSLPLTSLELHRFPFCDAFKQLLIKKGSQITELTIRPSTPVDSRHLQFIGEHCPILELLNVRGLGPESVGNDDNESFDNVQARIERKLFPNLVTLQLNGRLWNANVVLPLILSSATKVSKLNLMNMDNHTMNNGNHTRTMDKAFTKVLKSNKLANVTLISLCGCFLTIEILRRIVFGCDNLTCFSFSQSETLELADVARLREEISRKNLLIKLCCLERIIGND